VGRPCYSANQKRFGLSSLEAESAFDSLNEWTCLHFVATTTRASIRSDRQRSGRRCWRKRPNPSLERTTAARLPFSSKR